MLPPAQGGLASALNNTARQIGLAIGIAVLGALLEAGVSDGGGGRAFADGVGELLLISAGLSLLGALAAVVLVRQRDLWAPPARVASAAVEVRTTDYHTAGEPFRIVLEGGPELPGATVAERRARALESPDAQRVRRFLCHEPRGHADMYGCFLVEPDDAGAELGVLFWHKDGFSTACGHGTIALAAWAVESGRVAAPDDGEVELAIDVPSGRVGARVRMEGGAVAAVTFRNVPAYVLARGVEVDTARGRLAVDVSYGGAIYASLPAAAAGLAVEPARIGELTALGREIKWALNDAEVARHPSDERLSGIYGTILYDDLGAVAPAQRRGVRRRRGRPLAVRLGHLGPRRAARRRRPPARGRGAAARVDRRHGVPRAGRRAGDRGGPRRRRHGGRGHRPPDRRAPLRARPARPARGGVRAAMSAPAHRGLPR